MRRWTRANRGCPSVSGTRAHSPPRTPRLPTRTCTGCSASSRLPWSGSTPPPPGGRRPRLERLDLTATRRQLALLELHAEQTDGQAHGPALFYARACRAMFALTEGDL